MASCEKCWRDAHRGPQFDVVEEYARLIEERKDNPCSPEGQAGPDATGCGVCLRRAVHQYAKVCMNCGDSLALAGEAGETMSKQRAMEALQRNDRELAQSILDDAIHDARREVVEAVRKVVDRPFQVPPGLHETYNRAYFAGREDERATVRAALAKMGE